MKLSFSLKGKSVGSAPPLKPATPFATLGDDITDAAPTASTSNHSETNRQLAAQGSGATSKALRKKIEEEKKIDATVFEYDEVYDLMKQTEQKSKEKRDVEARERKPKYIGALLASAATRKLDYVRAEEKLIQREREEEGDEFADKDQFVTQAYKDQMAEVRRAEEEEKLREEMEKKKGPSTGMTHFYRQLLDRSEEQHSLTVAATKAAKGPIGPERPNLTIAKPPNLKSDLDLARAAMAEGKQVELNDDNQIVDKRELLSAGLNLSAPNTRHLGLRTSKANVSAANEEVNVHRAVGTAASRKEINERRLREIETQMVEERERLEKDRERERREQEERVVTRRNNEDEIESAKARYLERKRRKLSDGTAVAGDITIRNSGN